MRSFMGAPCPVACWLDIHDEGGRVIRRALAVALPLVAALLISAPATAALEVPAEESNRDRCIGASGFDIAVECGLTNAVEEIQG
jgi:hypothetical protein